MLFLYLNFLSSICQVMFKAHYSTHLKFNNSIRTANKNRSLFLYFKPLPLIVKIKYLCKLHMTMNKLVLVSTILIAISIN